MTRGAGALRVLFRVAAGPRIGFGHLVRANRLSEALGVEPALSVRGSPGVVDRLGAGGASPLSARLALSPESWDVVVVDDPHPGEASRWIARARRAGLPTVSVHDLGLGADGADLVVDGSVGAPHRRWTARRTLQGPRFAIVAPHRPSRPRPCQPTVLIGLGGGPRATAALAIARAIRRRVAARIEVAFGFQSSNTLGSGDRRRGIRAVTSGRFHQRLAGADIAVLAGGVGLYEGCAAAIACVGVAVVDLQRPTIEALARRGCVVDGGRLSALETRKQADAIATRVAALLADPARRRQLASRGRRLIDGRGARRVAAAIRSLATEPSRRKQA